MLSLMTFLVCFVDRFQKLSIKGLNSERLNHVSTVKECISFYLKIYQFIVLQPVIVDYLENLKGDVLVEFASTVNLVLTIAISVLISMHDYDFSFKMQDKLSQNTSMYKTLDLVLTILYCFTSQNSFIVLVLMPLAAVFRLIVQSCFFIFRCEKTRRMFTLF